MISRRKILRVLTAASLLAPGDTQAFPRGGGGLAFNSPMVIAGDSVMQALASINPTPVNWYNTMTSQVDWGNLFSGSRCRIPQGGNQAVGGQLSSAVAANFTSDLAQFNPRVIAANAGPSDIQQGGITAATILSNWSSMATQAAAMGAFLIVMPIFVNSIMAGNSGMLAIQSAVNAGLASMVSANPGKMALIDISTFNYLTDCYVQVGVGAGEQVHPNILGAFKLGASIASILESIIPAGTILQTASDPTNLANNGYMTGTSGTLISATGTVPTGWTVDGSGAGGATVVASITSNPAGGNWLNVTISGTYTGATPFIIVSNQFNISGVAENEQIEVTMALQADAGMSFIDAISPATLLISGSNVTQASLFQTNDTDVNGGYNVPQFSGPARVMPISMSAAVPTIQKITVEAYPRQNGSGTSIAGTFRFGQVGSRVIN